MLFREGPPARDGGAELDQEMDVLVVLAVWLAHLSLERRYVETRTPGPLACVI